MSGDVCLVRTILNETLISYVEANPQEKKFVLRFPLNYDDMSPYLPSVVAPDLTLLYDKVFLCQRITSDDLTNQYCERSKTLYGVEFIFE